MKRVFSTVIGIGRSGIIWFLVGLVTIFFFFIYVVDFLVVIVFDYDRKALHALSSAWARAILVVCPVMRVRLEQATRLSRKKPYIFVANHQSLTDVLVVLHINHPFKFVAKRQLFWIPFFGWGLCLAGYIPLERGDHKSGKETIERCRAYLKRGVSVLLFPEGTRSRDGEVHAFKVGAFKLSTDLQIPIVPITINGTRSILPKGSRFFNHRRADVRAYVGVPRLAKTAKASSGCYELMEDTRNEIISTLKKIRSS